MKRTKEGILDKMIFEYGHKKNNILWIDDIIRESKMGKISLNILMRGSDREVFRWDS